MIGIFLAVFQQMCGINAVIFYSTNIFAGPNDSDKSSQNSHDANLGTALVGIVNMLATIIAIILLRFFGRKTLLLVGYVAMGVCLLLLTIFYEELNSTIVKTIILIFIAFFAISAGPIMWLYNAEVLPNSGMGIATFFNWTTVIAISLLTP